jgi:hypothetical protein
MPSGEKQVKCVLKKHKLFIKATILLMVSDFFGTAYPKYNTEDKPNFYSSDPNCAPRQEIMLEMNEGLICFESHENS